MKKEIWIGGDRLALLFDLFHVLTFAEDPEDPGNSSSVFPNRLSWQKCRLWVKRRFGIQPEEFARNFAGLRSVFWCLAKFFRANQQRLERERLSVGESLLAMRGLNVGSYRALANALAADDFEDPGKMPDLYDARQGPQFARLGNDSL